MIIKEINDEKTWEEFLLEFNRKTFLNSWNWGEFRKRIGDTIFRKGVWIGNDLVAVFLVSKIIAKKGSFLLISYGPIIKENRHDVLMETMEELKRIGKKEKVSFLRIAPLWEEGSTEDRLIEKQGFIKSSCSVYPEKSWELSLNQNEDDILSKMRKGTRYMIRQGEKHGDFNISQSQDVAKFYEIYKKTSLRQNFKPFSYQYIKEEFKLFSEKDQATLFLAERNKECVAGAIIIFWQKIGFYHHGASMVGKKNPFAPHLLQWRAIKEARNRGCQRYNFWAISPNEDPKHPWSGLTFFKKGFGGYEVNYAKTKDLPISSRYWLTYFWERIKK